MKKLFILILLTSSSVSFAQTVSPENRIVVLGDAHIDIPADIVNFTVSLQGVDSFSVENAYKKHKAQEERIVKIIKDLNISDKDVTFSLMSIGKERRYVNEKNREQDFYVSNQTVSFKINSIKKYTYTQERLMMGNFLSFYSNFESSELNKRKKEILEKAVVVAQEKANILANSAKRKIKRIVKIADTEDTDPQFNNFHSNVEYKMMSIASDSNNGGLMDIPQTIQINARIKVVFELE
jgi:uncharacterized protein YggE